MEENKNMMPENENTETEEKEIKEIPGGIIVGTLALAGVGVLAIGKKIYNKAKPKVTELSAKAKEKKSKKSKSKTIEVEAKEVKEETPEENENKN